MKNTYRFFALLRWITMLSAIGLVANIETGCKTRPSARVVQDETLLAVGSAAKSSMDAATGLLKDGTITVTQWQTVADIYDTKFQPAYSLAVAAAKADLSTLASPDLTALAQQLFDTVGVLISKK
jgi:hypothetical protein